jgi:hypothetical protein
MIYAAVGILFIVALGWLWHGRLQPAQSPQALAFTTTFFAALFIVSGSIGFGLQKGPALFSDARWAGGVIWPQLWLGLAMVPVAVVCWRRAVRDANRRLGQ